MKVHEGQTPLSSTCHGCHSTGRQTARVVKWRPWTRVDGQGHGVLPKRQFTQGGSRWRRTVQGSPGAGPVFCSVSVGVSFSSPSRPPPLTNGCDWRSDFVQTGGSGTEGHRGRRAATSRARRASASERASRGARPGSTVRSTRKSDLTIHVPSLNNNNKKF